MTLTEGDQQVTLCSLGARLMDWRVSHQGGEIPVVLGYRDAESYRGDPFYIGALVGRVANRISGATFQWQGETVDLPANEGANLLHGGRGGFDQCNWVLERDGDSAVQMRVTSDHGDQGFPGRIEVTGTVRLCGGVLRYDIEARSDRPTPINIAQHAYYNLMGAGDILEHCVDIASTSWTPSKPDLTPHGTITSLPEAAMRLQQGIAVGAATSGQGVDMNYVLADHEGKGHARVSAPNGLALGIETDQPCLQLYTGRYLTGDFAPFSGLCLEPQGYPDAVNCGFPVSLATPDQPYRQTLELTLEKT